MPINLSSLLAHDAQPEHPLIPWLEHQKSMTEKLQAHTGDAQLTVLNSKWEVADWWDRYTLNWSPQPVFRREILMCSQSRPCWYARTSIPQSCYQLEEQFFNRLHHETLNHLIFDEPKITRTQFYTYSINQACIEAHWVPESFILEHSPLWVRFSEFSFLKQGTFSLCEIILPEFLRQLS